MENEDVALQAVADGLWTELRLCELDLALFLTKGRETDKTTVAAINSLKVVVHELTQFSDKYSKYPSKDYTLADFLALAAAKPSDKDVDFDNEEQCVEFMSEMRQVMWGYLKKNTEHFLGLLQRVLSDQKPVHLSEEDTDRLLECVCVAYLENGFRKKEMIFFEAECYKDRGEKHE